VSRSLQAARNVPTACRRPRTSREIDQPRRVGEASTVFLAFAEVLVSIR
jgi:hypothetical protein